MSITARAVAERTAGSETPIARFEGVAMGSPLRLTVVTARPAAGVAAWDVVRDEFEAAEAAMSRFREHSEITGLNRAASTGIAISIGRRLGRALVAADRAHRLTDGRFDPRVLVDLDRLGDRGAPIGGAWSTSTRQADERIADVHPRAALAALDEPIDLGGIGKGLALRWTAAALARFGIDRYLLDAGGDLVTYGPAPDGGPWRIGIEDPAGGPHPVAVVEVRDRAVATSSIRRRRWRHQDRLVHHLIDPRPASRQRPDSPLSRWSAATRRGRRCGPRPCSWLAAARSRTKPGGVASTPGG